MGENREYEELKERVNALESHVQTLIHQQQNSAGRFFIDFFKGFFVVLGALFWIVVIDVVLNNIASSWDLPVGEQGWYQLLILLISVVIFSSIVSVILFFRLRKHL